MTYRLIVAGRDNARFFENAEEAQEAFKAELFKGVRVELWNDERKRPFPIFLYTGCGGELVPRRRR